MRSSSRRSASFAAVALLALIVLAPRPARADGPAHAFGLGIELGAPSGLAMKYYLGASGGRGGMMALQAGIGEAYRWGPDGLHIHVDVVWHPKVLARTPDFSLPFYFGVGGRLLNWNNGYCYNDGNGGQYCGGDTDLGVRVPFGLLMDFHQVPFDVFVELAFVFDIIHFERYDSRYYNHDFLYLDGVIGARYYF